jgi:Xaa-Pro aminopeptidase
MKISSAGAMPQPPSLHKLDRRFRPPHPVAMRMTRLALLAALLLSSASTAAAQKPDWPLRETEELAPAVPPIVPLRERARIEDGLLKDRLDTLIPELMRERGVDMWILIAREYQDDEVLQTMLDAENFTARRRTILVFHDPGQGKPVERLTVSRYGLGGLFDPAWSPEEEPDQWKRLTQILLERDPRDIAINSDGRTAFGDGLTLSQYQQLVEAVPPHMRERLTPAGDMAINWLETRTPGEMALYPMIVRTAHAIMAEGLSRKAITPGVTTVTDLEWWLRERIAELKLDTWFHPGIAIFRQGSVKELAGDTVFQPGDMVWLDFGITYLGLNTDTQHLAYILKPGETDAPAGLKAGLAAANKVQDALTSSYRTGLSGNEILLEARRKALAQGLEPTIYSHQIGFHGHAAGAAIGFWDDQAPSPRGDHKLRPNVAWSIELSAHHTVPEWGNQRVQFRTEEDAFFDGKTVRYIDGRQTQMILIRP